MGSYLSIVNNTPDPYMCKLGPDEAAIRIAGILGTVLTASALLIASAGALAPLTSYLAANGVISIVGVSTTALVTVTETAASVTGAVTAAGTASGFTVALAQGLLHEMKKQDFIEIPAGQSYRWGKMSLSLWQQGTCVRTTIVDEKTVKTDTVYMRPIFSGATDGSNNDHEIQFWIDKFGFETDTMTAETA